MMERVETLTEIVRREVADYQVPGLKSKSYFVADEANNVYAVLDVPDAPRQFNSAIALLARVENDRVIIEEDIHDRPLWEALVEAGVPRERIVLAYVG